MLKDKTKNIVAILLIMIIIAIASTSMAADYTCKVSLHGNKTELKKGESVTVLVKATEIQAGQGIASFNAMLEYDSNVFSITVNGDDEGVWTKQGLIENSLSMSRSDLEANSSDQTIAKIIITAKQDATVGKHSFKMTKMEFSTGEETFSVADVGATFTIKEDSGSGNNGGNNNEENNNAGNNNGNNQGNTNTANSNMNGSGSIVGGNSNAGGSSSQGGTKKPTSIGNVSASDTTIPKTGITDVLVIGAVIGVIAAVIFYVKYRRAY